jgi:predicted HNH restriction endonuclease
LRDDADPVKTQTTGGVLPGRPIAMQESLLDWSPKKRLPRVVPLEAESGDLESALAASADDLHEGARIRVQADRYERDSVARAACIQHYGPTCVICGFNFAAAYGDAAAGFIHVHHLRPLSADGGDHPVDPIADLRPLCPNCHSFVHLRIPPIKIDEAIGVVKVAVALRADHSDRD